MITRLPDAKSVALEAASQTLSLATEAVRDRGRCVIGLSGGSTPRALHQLLTQAPFRAAMPWRDCRFVFGDERSVGPESDQSNYRMARDTLFEPIGIPDSHVLRMEGEYEAGYAARDYEERLRKLFPNDDWPPIDLLFLGMGEDRWVADGHTASLFPGTEALHIVRRIAGSPTTGSPSSTPGASR